jgi:hypothetical protein
VIDWHTLIPAWSENANCKDLTPAMADHIFFNQGRASKQIPLLCNPCPVRDRCEQAGQTEEYGKWGGKSAKLLQTDAAPKAA